MERSLVSSPIFAITTRGLEPVSAAEVAAVPGLTIDEVAYRRVVATCQGSAAPLLALRTVDDVFLHAATWPGIGRTRSALETIRTASARLTLDRLAHLRPDHPEKSPVFSVTANFVGRRNYTTPEIKQACGEGIREGLGWTWSENDEAGGLNVRLFLEAETALVGLRLGDRPVSRRPYKHAHVPGSLKPTVAAALAALVGVGPGMTVLDPCCGAGTILIEAAVSGGVAAGGDRTRAAIQAARDNARSAGRTVTLGCWDARALPVPDHSVARIISNLPWGRAVETPDLESLYRDIGRELARVLAPGGQAALLTTRPDLVRLPGLDLAARTEISLSGQTPTILIWRDPG